MNMDIFLRDLESIALPWSKFDFLSDDEKLLRRQIYRKIVKSLQEKLGYVLIPDIVKEAEVIYLNEASNGRIKFGVPPHNHN